METAPTSNKQLDVTDGGWYEIKDITKHMKVKGVLHLGSAVYVRQVGAHSLTLGHGGRLVCLYRRRVQTTVRAGVVHTPGRTQLCTDHRSVVVVVAAGRKPRVVHESFFVTRSNPTHQQTDPTHYKWKLLDPTRSDRIQVTNLSVCCNQIVCNRALKELT